MTSKNEFDDLNRVLTIAEACEIFGVLRSTILYHIDRGHIEARQTGDKRSLWLVSRASLARYYSTPTVQRLTARKYHDNG